MTESDHAAEMVRLFRELTTRVKSIDSKLDYEVNHIDINESLGEFYLKKLEKENDDMKKSEEDNDLYNSDQDIELNKLEKDIEIADSYVETLSKDIEDGIECICSGMQKYYIDQTLCELGYDLEQMQENKIKFDTKNFLNKLAETIDHTFTNMISELKPRITKLHHKIKRKYIFKEQKSPVRCFQEYEHKEQLNSLEPFVNDKGTFHPAIVRWNS